MKSTFERIMEAKTPAQRKKHEEGYRDFLLSEMILAAVEEDDISVRKLAKLANVSPSIVQEATMSKRPTFEEFKKRAMQDEKFKAEYELLKPEFEITKIKKNNCCA